GVLEHGRRRLRKQDLSAARGGHYARRAMDAETVIAVVGHAGLARVHSHSHSKLGSVRPGMFGERPLRLDRGESGVTRPTKGDEEGIALRIDLLSSVLFERGTNNPPILTHHPPLPVS